MANGIRRSSRDRQVAAIFSAAERYPRTKHMNRRIIR